MISTDFHLIAELTNRCNLACVHCFRTNNIAPQPDMPLDLYEKFLVQAQTYHARHITLTGGGEPTLHPQFDSILALTARHGYSFTLATNGVTFPEISPLLEPFRDALKAVAISLDGANAQTHDAIRGQAGAYQKAVQACLICYYKQFPFSLSMAVQRMNMAEIEAMAQLAQKLGAEALNLGCAQLTPRLVSQGLALTPEERKRTRSRIMTLAGQPGGLHINPVFDFFIENPCFPCETLRMSSLTLDYRGYVRFCCQLSDESAGAGDPHDMLGNLRDSSVWDCHRTLAQRAAEFQQEKIRRIEQQLLTENDHFPCYYCAKYFHKLDWLTHFPHSEWNR